MTDFEMVRGDFRVRYRGLGKTLRALSKAGADAGDMKDLMHRIGMLVVTAAQPPVGATRKLSQTLRAGRGKTKAVVRAGGARAKYAGVIHYGWPAHHIAPNPFLLRALQQERPQVVQTLSDGLGEILHKNGLQ